MAFSLNSLQIKVRVGSIFVCCNDYITIHQNKANLPSMIFPTSWSLFIFFLDFLPCCSFFFLLDEVSPLNFSFISEPFQLRANIRLQRSIRIFLFPLVHSCFFFPPTKIIIFNFDLQTQSLFLELSFRIVLFYFV